LGVAGVKGEGGGWGGRPFDKYLIYET
jgi:hypothetical protein